MLARVGQVDLGFSVFVADWFTYIIITRFLWDRNSLIFSHTKVRLNNPTLEALMGQTEL